MALQYKPLPPEVFNIEARPHIARLNLQLRELFALEGTIREPRDSSRSDSSVVRRDTTQVHVTRITPDIMDVVSGVSVVMGQPGLTFGLTNTIGSSTSAISVNSAIALFTTALPPPIDASAGIAGLSSTAANLGHRHQVLTAAPTIDYSASAAAEGSTVTLLRSGATLLAPTFLRSTANASTLTLTDDGTNQTLTASLGDLTLTGQGVFTVDARNGSGNLGIAVNLDPDSGNRTGIRSGWFGGDVSSATLACWDATMSALAGVFTTATFAGFQNGTFSFTPSPGSDTNNNAYSANLIGPLINNANGGWLEVAGLNITGPRRVFSNPSVTLAATTILECPTISGTSQIGLYIKQRTAQHTATNRYGIFVEAQNSGTNRYVLYGVSDTLYHGGTIRHAGVRAGLYGATPTVQFGTTGTEAGFAAGSSTAVTVDSTFTGDTGSTAYTFGDTVRALKLLGALAY